MALTESNMLPLGTEAPTFSLVDTNGERVNFDANTSGKGFLVMFICNHCPYVKHLKKPLAAITKEFQDKGIAVYGINSNDVENYPDDHPEKMAQDSKEFGYSFPYLFDETQEIAKAYQAACTPDFFVFDKNKKLSYRGQFDESRPGDGKPIDGKDLREALENVLKNEAPLADQKPSIGCNIKWKA